MEEKIKHLEFIQNIISRMNSNSFLIKGWVITLVSALFALSANGSNPKYVLITYIVIPIFWILDGYFLSKERQYRKLYEEVAILSSKDVTFSLYAKKYNAGKQSWFFSIFSLTLNIFYTISLLTTLLVMFLFQL